MAPAIKPSRTHRRAFKVSRVRAAVLLTVIFVVLSLTYWATQPVVRDNSVPTVVSIPPVEHFVFDGANTVTPLVFPNAFAAAWEAHPHLVAIDVTMRSDDNCLETHALHKKTWANLPGVAHLANGFQGLFLPLYLAEAVQKTVPYLHAGVEKRLNRDGNILIFRSIEEASNTGKGIGAGPTKDYGASAMFAMTRKESLWFRYAYQHFPHTPFLGKADLDVYINVPAYLSVLQQLPRVSTSYGRTRPVPQLYCIGEHALMYILGPLYTATRDIAREVFTESIVMRVLADPYNESKDRGTFRPLGFRHADTLHSKTLFRRYAATGVQRAFPTQEFNDALAGASQLPPLVGMGKLYMEQMAAEGTPKVPLNGTVEGLFGYSYKYTLPGPLNRTHLIFVTDNCRYRDERDPQPEPYNILSHRPSTEASFTAQHKKYNIDTNTFTKMSHPTLLEVEDHEFYYHVTVSNGFCGYDGKLRTDSSSDLPTCWRTRPHVETQPSTA